MKTPLTLILSLCLMVSLAQDGFEVFYIKGSTSLVESTGSTELKRGMKFTKEIIDLGDKSMLVLMNAEGRNLKIANQGMYGAKDISKLYKKPMGTLLPTISNMFGRK